MFQVSQNLISYDKRETSFLAPGNLARVSTHKPSFGTFDKENMLSLGVLYPFCFDQSQQDKVYLFYFIFLF
jgi:hypothetical protein